MLYPKTKEKELSGGLFLNPTSEYRGAPFWAWNTELDKDELSFQIDVLKQMGFGGFHMHSRTGMATEYLSEEFFDFVKFCAEKAEKEGMLAWLYDEDRWPSGSAGGLVTKNIRHRGKKLVLTTVKEQNVQKKETAIETGEPYLVACFDIVLDSRGRLKSFDIINEENDATGAKWYAYVLTNEDTPWYNNQAYVDTLSKDAMDAFISLTYEGYKKAVGEKFGKTVPAIFTDEPQFNMRTFLANSGEKGVVELPWTTDFDKIYEKHTNGKKLIEHIPELVWERADGEISDVRYHYVDCLAEQFVISFMDNCAKWCTDNGIYLTGHMMLEPTLELQSWATGDVMRAYRNFTLPGIDILCERMEFSTAKQAQSVVHQYAREGMLSELYGVTNWDYDFRGHKFQGDWQAALGVTVRVPHLSWMSMKGEAKRDYPSTFNYQSPWHKEYSYIENHYARIATALTRGTPCVKVAVIHPTETYWLYAGAKDLTSDKSRNMDEKFKNVIEWLIFNHIDFDFISESLLPDLCKKGTKPLNVGAMQYEAVVVPGCETLRKTTLDILSGFNDDGGKLIFMGKCPDRINGEKSKETEPLFEKSIRIDYDKCELLEALKDERDVRIINSDGITADNLIYQMRKDENCHWLFIAQGKKQWEHNAVQTNIKEQNDAVSPQNVKITVKGIFVPEIYDTMTGEIKNVSFYNTENETVIMHTLYINDSVLLKLSEGAEKQKLDIEKKEEISLNEIDFKKCVEYELEEDNVYLLDRAEFSFDGGEKEAEEEILRIDNRLRERIGWPLRQKKIAQPWAEKEGKARHEVCLHFKIMSEIEKDEVFLALENADEAEITFNGEKVSKKICGYFVDKAINKLPLYNLKKGENVLSVKMPYYRRGSLEWMYILGDFGVKLAGCEKTITEKPLKIGFGSIAYQGFPFYGGNITYKLPFEAEEEALIKVKASAYRGMFMKAAKNGEESENIAFAPYECRLGKAKKGKNEIKIKLFGNRHNTFACLHNANTATYYFGPDSWRSDGDAWGYEYFTKDFGILKSPIITLYK